MDPIKVKTNTGFSCFEVENLVFHDEPKRAVGRRLKGTNICRMRLGHILSSVDFIIHHDQDTLISSLIVTRYA